jgi:hypothetical protein
MDDIDYLIGYTLKQAGGLVFNSFHYNTLYPQGGEQVSAWFLFIRAPMPICPSSLPKTVPLPA